MEVLAQEETVEVQAQALLPLAALAQEAVVVAEPQETTVEVKEVALVALVQGQSSAPLAQLVQTATLYPRPPSAAQQAKQLLPTLPAAEATQPHQQTAHQPQPATAQATGNRGAVASISTVTTPQRGPILAKPASTA